MAKTTVRERRTPKRAFRPAMLHLEDRKLMAIDMTMAPPPTAVAG